MASDQEIHSLAVIPNCIRNAGGDLCKSALSVQNRHPLNALFSEFTSIFQSLPVRHRRTRKLLALCRKAIARQFAVVIFQQEFALFFQEIVSGI